MIITIPAPFDAHTNEDAADLLKIERIMNREFTVSPPPPRHRDGGYRQSKHSRKSHDTGHGKRSHRHRSHQAEVKESDRYSPASVSKFDDDIQFDGRDMKGTIAVGEFVPLPFEENDDSSALPISSTNCGLNRRDSHTSLCAILGLSTPTDKLEETPEGFAQDTFDPEEMPAPLTAALIPLRHEFHRRSKSVAHPSYSLGQIGNPIDMVSESNEESAKFAASLLRIFDGAFIRRSGGRWSYAILAEKIQPENNYNNWSLRFVVDENGSTKSISMYKWGEYVRMVREPVEANALLNKLQMRVKGGDGTQRYRSKRNSKVVPTRNVQLNPMGKLKGLDLMDPCTW